MGDEEKIEERMIELYENREALSKAMREEISPEYNKFAREGIWRHRGLIISVRQPEAVGYTENEDGTFAVTFIGKPLKFADSIIYKENAKYAIRNILKLQFGRVGAGGDDELVE